MPIYEYQCELCGEQLDKLQKVSDAPLTDCPACGKAGLKKLISKSAFHLKGSGWYVTDFKNQDKDKSKTDKAETKSESTNKKEKPTASETKTEKKNQPKIDKDS